MLKTCCAVLMGLVMAATANGADSESVALNIDRTGFIVLPVSVNGQGPFSFLLDTGSNRSAVGADLAALLGFPVVARTSLVTSTGTPVSDPSSSRSPGVSAPARRRCGSCAWVERRSEIRRLS